MSLLSSISHKRCHEMSKKSKSSGRVAKRKKRAAEKHSRAYSNFENVISRSLNLLTLESKLDQFQSSASTKLDLSDLIRSAVVLAVAAMDAYFTDVFAEHLVRYLKEKGAGKCLTKTLSEAGLDTRTALELIAMKRPYRRIRSLIEAHLERTTTQRADAIDELFIGYGIQNFCVRAQGIAGRKNLISSVRKLVERRNEIAHDGDINSHGSLQAINSKMIRRKVTDVVTFVSASEKLLARTMA